MTLKAVDSKQISSNKEHHCDHFWMGCFGCPFHKIQPRQEGTLIWLTSLQKP